MPELPEVEVIRLFLTPTIQNLTITKLDILNPKSFQGQSKRLLNQKITHLTRHGKQLSIHLQNKKILLIHLKMTGQLIYLTSKSIKTTLGHPTPNLSDKSLPNRSTRLIFTFSNDSQLFFNDQRKFGWIRLLTPRLVKQFQQHLGPDLLSHQFTSKYFFQQLQSSSRPIKNLLHDQSRFAGIGNIYANDALFLSQIHPLTPANNISKTKATRLHHQLLKIINTSIISGGSTAKDNQYIRPDGTPGQNQYNFSVYQRLGKPCLVCSASIIRLKLSGRSAFYCPHCQKTPKSI